MFKKRNRLIVAILFSSYLSIGAAETQSTQFPGLPPNFQPIKVTVLAFKIFPGSFWDLVTQFMAAAAEDLNMNLEVLDAKSDRNQMLNQAQAVVKRKNPPDYLVVANVKNIAEKMIQAANQAGVKVFLMNTGFDAEEQKQLGSPRQKYRYWIGQFLPDDYLAGYQAANLLIEQVLRAGVTAKDGKVHLMAIAGDRTTLASSQRLAGLKQALAEHSKVVIHEVTIYAHWEKNQAQRRVLFDLTQAHHPNLNAIWAANDSMALGAIDAVVANHQIPGKDIFITGMDWMPPALQAVKAGTLLATLGGHFMDGGWVMVLLHDYHYGKDFIQETTSFKSQLFALNASNIDNYLNRFDQQNWQKINFRQFSKIYTPLVKYNFSVESVIQ